MRHAHTVLTDAPYILTYLLQLLHSDIKKQVLSMNVGVILCSMTVILQ